MEKKRYKQPSVCLCRNCAGTGIETVYHTTDLLNEWPVHQTCTLCGGSGRVVVSAVYVTTIKAYKDEKGTD